MEKQTYYSVRSLSDTIAIPELLVKRVGAWQDWKDMIKTWFPPLGATSVDSSKWALMSIVRHFRLL